MSDGPHQNTSGYIRLQNNMISLWVDPTELGDEHFGPTPIYGMTLPDRCKMDDDWDDDDNAGNMMQQGNMTQGDNADDGPGGTVAQGASGDDDDNDLRDD